MSESNVRRIVVPVADSVTMRDTVAYAVGLAAESFEEIEEGKGGEDVPSPRVDFIQPVSWKRDGLRNEAVKESEETLDRVRTWVYEDLGIEREEETDIEINTEVVETDEYLFSLKDYADTVVRYARRHRLDHVVLDPEYHPRGRGYLLTPLETEIDLAEGITYEKAPVEREVRGREFLGGVAEPTAFGATFVLSFLFYQVLGGFSGSFDYITGGITAVVVASVVSGITFETSLSPVSAVTTTVRWLGYVPQLLWKIAVANVEVAYIVLHPSLPIDPSIESVKPAVPSGLPATTLANSITLTPGTVTVDVRGREFKVHALTESAREGLYAGEIERLVRFVFFGRAAMGLPSPSERGEAETRTLEDDQ